MTEEKYKSVRNILNTLSNNLMEISTSLKSISDKSLIDPRGLSEISIRLENISVNINYVVPHVAKHALDKAMNMLNGEDKEEPQHNDSSVIVDNLLKELKENTQEGHDY